MLPPTSAPCSRSAVPLGTASYDPDVPERARRAASALMAAVPELEEHETAVVHLLERALAEQDRASRADEVLRRFSPSLRKYIQAQVPPR